MSEDQPGDVRSQSFNLCRPPSRHTLRQSLRPKNRLGLSSSNRQSHRLLLLSLLIPSTVLRTFLAISTHLPRHLSFYPLCPLPSSPVRRHTSMTSSLCSPCALALSIAYWCERPELFAAIAQGTTPEDRARRVLKWFISTLKGQYTSRNETMGSEKK